MSRGPNKRDRVLAALQEAGIAPTATLSLEARREIASMAGVRPDYVHYLNCSMRRRAAFWNDGLPRGAPVVPPALASHSALMSDAWAAGWVRSIEEKHGWPPLEDRERTAGCRLALFAEADRMRALPTASWPAVLSLAARLASLVGPEGLGE